MRYEKPALVNANPRFPVTLNDHVFRSSGRLMRRRGKNVVQPGEKRGSSARKKQCSPGWHALILHATATLLQLLSTPLRFSGMMLNSNRKIVTGNLIRMHRAQHRRSRTSCPAGPVLKNDVRPGDRSVKAIENAQFAVHRQLRGACRRPSPCGPASDSWLPGGRKWRLRGQQSNSCHIDATISCRSTRKIGMGAAQALRPFDVNRTVTDRESYELAASGTA